MRLAQNFFTPSVRYENPFDIFDYSATKRKEKKRKKEAKGKVSNAKPCKKREVVLSVGTFRAIKPIVRKYRKIEAGGERSSAANYANATHSVCI